MYTFAPYEVVGSAIPSVTAGEVAAGVGAAGTATQLPTFESNYPTDVFEEGFTPSEANPVSGPENVPFEDGFIPSEANPVSGPTPSLTPAQIAEKIGEWALKNPGAVLTGVGMLGGALENPDDGSASGGAGTPGWNGPVTDYAVGRTYTAAPAGYRPGFSPEHQYVDYMFMPTSGPNAGQPVGGSPGTTPPNPGQDIPPPPPPRFAQGGIASLMNGKGGVTKGPGDGTSDSIPASIDGQQEAALSTDEFVVPADVVSDLGNGSSEAGAQVLYAMMDRVRQARHGTTQQPRDIDPGKLLPA
jgi:hypothetical protein